MCLNEVEKLKGADRLLSRKKVFRDDSLQRGHGATNKEKDDSKKGPLNLDGRRKESLHRPYKPAWFRKSKE